MKLDEHLSAIYKADLNGNRTEALAKFMTALVQDPTLCRGAAAKLKALDELVAARGEGACAYSTKYRKYLKEALG